ncbi:helix-turn-helix domain-containing protein [Ligilactobacillus murinus]|uniref:helix-turn-helix domain-containing protein n=1 Tax=Ligilactobacillus murinus TaxID=1622 RepID=UPI00138F7981|nr:helix-turn-helix transcriptional regulator [Ligilactobacillus murinus]
MEFGKVLKQIRISRNLKQTDLSQDFLSRTSISKIENGKQIPAYDTAVKLILNCQIKLEKNYMLICNVLHEYF